MLFHNQAVHTREWNGQFALLLEMLSFGQNWGDGETTQNHWWKYFSAEQSQKPKKLAKWIRVIVNFLYCILWCLMNNEKIVEKEISKLFVENTKRKNYFFATCQSLDKSVDLDRINRGTPVGELIRVGDSKLEKILRRLKSFRLHATIHDTAGYLETYPNLGPGYCYMVPFFNFILKNFFLGTYQICFSKMSPRFRLIKVWTIIE